MLKLKFYRFISIAFILVETLSIIDGYVIVKHAISMALMFSISYILFPKAFHNKHTFFLLFYSILICVYHFLGHTVADFKWIRIEVLVPLSCLSLYNVFLFNRDEYGFKLLTAVGLTIMVLTSLLTIPIAVADPEAVRSMIAYSSEGDITSLQHSKMQGIASAGLIHSIPFIFPLLVYHLKKKRPFFYRFIVIATILIPYILLIEASFATPLILSTLGLFCSFIVSTNMKKNIVILIGMSCLFLVFLDKQLVLVSLSEIQYYFVDTALDNKFKDISISIEHGNTEGQVGGRNNLYKKSWNTFLEEPLFGSLDKSNAGEHSYIVDRLAYFGIVGIIPLFLFCFCTFKNMYVLCYQQCKIYLLFSYILFTMMLFLKNSTGIEIYIYIFVYIPGLCLYVNENKRQLSQFEGATKTCGTLMQPTNLPV